MSTSNARYSICMLLCTLPKASGLGQSVDEGGNDKELINYALRYTPASIISDICRHTFFDKTCRETRLSVRGRVLRHGGIKNA